MDSIDWIEKGGDTDRINIGKLIQLYRVELSSISALCLRLYNGLFSVNTIISYSFSIHLVICPSHSSISLSPVSFYTSTMKFGLIQTSCLFLASGVALVKGSPVSQNSVNHGLFIFSA